jgi:hypothetical protein
MTQRNRKLIGTMLMLVLIVGWAALATSIYLALPAGLPIWLLLIYFAVAGLGWGFPAAWLIGWMARPD